MAGVYENLPFQRGTTYGGADNTIAVQYEGKEYLHQDLYYGTGEYVRLRVCRNNSGISLAPKRAVKFNKTAGKPWSDVAGYADVTAERSGIVDEKLPAGGAPTGDLFYVIVEGPTLASTSLAADTTNSIAVGDALHAQTGATTGATTSGRVGEALFTGATSVLAGQVENVIGYAMSARTTANTGSDILINAGRF